ncbi:MAG TPA: DegT/DnrJ/EryC1/StrS family aminotransferase [Streptosporangiaceae bacterium]|nr:DegT/DnrJ/EryC1/StrS family aminotransferase [Streptosporangiaceae bacterium]
MGVPAARIVFPADDRAEIAAAVTEILATGSLTLGPYTRRFEEAFAAAHGARYAAATSSGTAALDIALRVAGVRGRDVIVPANTFYATAAAVLQAGGNPVFADIDPGTFALSPATVEAALTPDTADEFRHHEFLAHPRPIGNAVPEDGEVLPVHFPVAVHQQFRAELRGDVDMPGPAQVNRGVLGLLAHPARRAVDPDRAGQQDAPARLGEPARTADR